MKKSFLHTFVVLSVFTIFVFGNISSVFAQIYITPDGRQLTPGTANSNTGVPTTGQSQGNPANGNSTVMGAVGDALKSAGGAILGAVIDPVAKVTIIPLIQTGAAWILQVTGALVYLTGGIFDKILQYTIVDQSLFEGLNSSIGAAWKIVRDIANIVIVFSLLYLGIKTILDGNGFAETKVLISIIIAAILINFSLVITKTVFNVSNIIGAQIGEQIKFDGKASGSPGAKSLLVAGSTDGVDSISEGLVGMIRPDKVIESLYKGQFSSEWQDMWNKVQSAIFTSVTLLMMIVIFLGASILLMYRFLAFVVLMITAPVGITSKFVPAFSKIGDKWWSTLKAQAIVLPVFLLTLYISILFVAPLSQNLSASALGSITGTVSSTGAAEQMVVFFFNYLLIIGFLLLPLIVPGKVGAAGSEMMTGAADWTTKKIRSLPKRSLQRSAQVAAGGSARASRAVLGGMVGRSLKDGKTMKKWSQNTDKGPVGFVKRTLGQTAVKTGAGLQNRTYDVRNIDAISKSDFGKGMGKGIDGWSKTVKTKKENLEKKKKEEMKLFGFDKMHESAENVVKITRAEAIRDDMVKNLEERKEFYKQGKDNPNMSDAELARLQVQVQNAQKYVKNAEIEVGRLKNLGESEYTKQLEGRMFASHGGSRPSATTQAAFYDSKTELNKKWEAAGQSKNKKKQKREDEWLDTGGTPPPPDNTPPTTPPATP